MGKNKRLGIQKKTKLDSAKQGMGKITADSGSSINDVKHKILWQIQLNVTSFMDKSQQFRFANFEINHKTGISNKVKLGSNEQFRKKPINLILMHYGTSLSDSNLVIWKNKIFLLHFLKSCFKPEFVKIEYGSLFYCEFHGFRS